MVHSTTIERELYLRLIILLGENFAENYSFETNFEENTISLIYEGHDTANINKNLKSIKNQMEYFLQGLKLKMVGDSLEISAKNSHKIYTFSDILQKFNINEKSNISSQPS